MSKRVLLLTLAVLMAVGIYTAVANAGVEGDFTFDFNITPQTTIAQVDKFDFNFEGILNLDITISGLTISNYVTFGIAGLETYVVGLSTTLGALDLSDEFWFSVPYGGPTSCSGYNCDLRLDDTLYFVKKRVDASMTLGGLTFDLLVMFEDINFSYPYTHTPVGDQDFQFGACFTLSGTTVSGIGVESITGINCDPQDKNKIKKYSAYGAVQTDTLGFTVEKINITGVEIGPLTIDNTFEFRPSEPVSFTTTISTSLLGWDIVITGSTTDITAIPAYDSVTFSASLGDYFSVAWYDDGDFVLDSGDAIYVSGNFPIQSATVSTLLVTVPGVGIVSASYGISIPVSIGTFSASVDYAGSPLKWDTFTFGLSSDVAGLGVDMTAEFGVLGLNYIDIKLNIPFSA